MYYGGKPFAFGNKAMAFAAGGLLQPSPQVTTQSTDPAMLDLIGAVNGRVDRIQVVLDTEASVTAHDTFRKKVETTEF